MAVINPEITPARELAEDAWARFDFAAAFGEYLIPSIRDRYS